MISSGSSSAKAVSYTHLIENLEEIYIYPACELVLTEEERRNGVAKIQKEAEKAAEKFRKEMKTEEAYRVKSMADQIAEETMEYGITAGLDAYLSYFCEERVSLLDYLKKEDSIVFLDETVRTIERGPVSYTHLEDITGVNDQEQLAAAAEIIRTRRGR